MENELLTLHEYPSSHLGFIVLPVARSLVFCVMICRLLFGLFVLCGGAIELSVLLRVKDYHYPFGIFKLFLHIIRIPIVTVNKT